MNRFTITTTLILCITLSSCLSIIANKTGLKEKSPKVEKLQIPNKEVYFLGMVHLANKEYYENAKKTITDFQNKGFIFYLESINGLDSNKKIIDTTSLKKLRKLTGLNLTKKYSQNTNPLLEKLIEKYRLIDQPSYVSQGITNFRWIDYTYTDLIRLYEIKYKSVVLDSCDIKTSLKAEYLCKRTDKTTNELFKNEIVFLERNKLIADKVLNSIDSKIVIIYGAKHLEGIKEQLSEVINRNK